MILNFGGRNFEYLAKKFTPNLVDNILTNAQNCQSASNNNYVDFLPVNWNHRVRILLWWVVKMKHLLYTKMKILGILGIWLLKS